MKGDAIPDSDHVLRYVGGGNIDRGVVNGKAFLARDSDRGRVSVNWLEHWPGTLEERVSEIRKRLQLEPGATAKLVRINVGDVRVYVAQEDPMHLLINVEEDPLNPTEKYPLPDPSHASMHEIPSVEHLGRAIVGALIARCVIDMFPAREPVLPSGV